MKITFVCGDGTHFSGGNQVIALYAQKRQQRSHEVLMVCPSQPKPSLIEQMRSLLTRNGGRYSPFEQTNIPQKSLNHPVPVTDIVPTGLLTYRRIVSCIPVIRLPTECGYLNG